MPTPVIPPAAIPPTTCFSATVAGNRIEVVADGQRMGDYHVRHEVGQGLDFFATVFVDVDQYMRWFQRAQLFDVEAFGAAQFGDPADHLSWMDAEAGTANQHLGEVEGHQQFGQAWHQRDDARTA